MSTPPDLSWMNVPGAEQRRAALAAELRAWAERHAGEHGRKLIGEALEFLERGVRDCLAFRSLWEESQENYRELDARFRALADRVLEQRRVLTTDEF